LAAEDPDRLRGNRGFLLLWLIEGLSDTALHAIWYGILVLIELRSDSATLLSLALVTLLLPSALVGVVAGVFIDRWDTRLVLVVANTLRAFLAASYALFAMPAAPPLGLLLLGNLLFSTVNQFFNPAEEALIPALVAEPRLLAANGLFHLTYTGAQVVGLVVIGPLLARAVGVGGLFVTAALAMLSCSALAFGLPATRRVASDHLSAAALGAAREVIRDLRILGQFLARQRDVLVAMAQWSLGSCLGLSVVTLAPGFAERTVRARAEDVVFLLAPGALGLVGGVLVLTWRASGFSRRLLVAVGLLSTGLSLVMIGGAAIVLERFTHGTPWLIELPILGRVSILAPVVMALAPVVGLGLVAIMVPTQTTVQERAPVQLRGRVLALQLTLANLVTIIPLVVLAILADLVGPNLVLVGLGVTAGLAGAAGLLLPPEPPRATPVAGEG
jgi:MFS family permease